MNSRSLFRKSLVLVPILFFLWMIMDGLTYHYTESFFHDFKYTIAYVLPLAAAVFHLVNKYLAEKQNHAGQKLLIVTWSIVVVITFCVFIFSHIEF